MWYWTLNVSTALYDPQLCRNSRSSVILCTVPLEHRPVIDFAVNFQRGWHGRCRQGCRCSWSPSTRTLSDVVTAPPRTLGVFHAVASQYSAGSGARSLLCDCSVDRQPQIWRPIAAAAADAATALDAVSTTVNGRTLLSICFATEPAKTRLLHLATGDATRTTIRVSPRSYSVCVRFPINQLQSS